MIQASYQIDKKSYDAIGIYNIAYITVKKTGDYDNIHSVNSLHLMTNKADRFTEKRNGSKYLIFDSAEPRSMELHSRNENKRVIKNSHNFEMGLKMNLKQ